MPMSCVRRRGLLDQRYAGIVDQLVHYVPCSRRTQSS
jgi:hypothetical protein